MPRTTHSNHNSYTKKPSKTAAASSNFNGLLQKTAMQASLSQTTLSDANYAFIRDLIYKETRINLGDSKRELVTARLGKRLRATGSPSFDDYCRNMKKNDGGGELYHLIDAISTNHTFFFREINHFNYLEKTILPSFSRGEFGNSSNLKVWSCACSTGEEPYSLAITLESFFQKNPGCEWNMQCSDISTRVLDFASKGIYERERIKQVKPEWQRKYFQKGEREMDGYFRVHPKLARKLNFQRINLFQNSFPWKEKFDIIFCRNVMIYFDRDTQEKLVNRLAKHLTPGGYLMIGHAESLAGVHHPYATVKPAIYQLKR